MFLLLIQLVVVVTVARVVGSAFRAVGQTRVVGEIVAGLLLGPSFLGWMFPSITGQLFPVESLPLLNAFSQVGLVLFMFVVGIRLDLSHLSASRRIVVLTSIASMVLPFVLGVGLAMAIRTQFGVPDGMAWPFALFVGLSLSITAFPVLVRIVDEHELSATRLGTVAIACAALDDVTAWIVLALVTAFARADTVSASTSAVGVIVYAAVMLSVIRPVIHWWTARITDAEGRMAVLVIAAIASAAATERLGVHPLFGAFFLGALAPRDHEVERFLTVRVEAFEQSNSSRKRERDERPARREETAAAEQGAAA